MLTSSSSAALLLLPLKDQDRAGSPFSLWSSLPTLLTVSSGGGPVSSTAATAASSLQQQPPHPLSMDRVCPYPNRGTLLACGRPPSTQQAPSPAMEQDPTAAVPESPIPPSRGPEPTPPPYSLDFERLRSTVGRLEASGWYYGKLSWQQATALLDRQPLGTFLLRDSSDPQFLFALSVQTERGPTSIRIHYRDGQFQLDAEERLNENMPFFECVVALVEHYARLSQMDKAKGHVWLDFFGRRDLRVRLGRPLRHSVPALQHLSRLTINNSVPVWKVGELDLPRVLRLYLLDYPYRR